MSVQSFPVLDGICPSWADIIVRASPVGAPLIEVNDIKSIDTGTSMEIGEMRGASGGRVIKRTTGSVKYEASMTLYASGFNKLLRGLIAASHSTRGNQYRLSLVHFGLQVMFTPPGTDEIFEFRIKGCRYTGRKYAAAEGVDAQPVDVNLNAIEIVDMIDGKECVLL